ncbi:MAG: phosphatase PAP2 family protein [Chloroflexi bacterium]|nr:phosphatase PAP2 family protein [Chloroflexota bacterium]
MSLDVWLFHLINDFVGAIPLMDWLARALVNDHAVPTTMALIAIGVWFSGATEEERARNRRAVIFIALGILFTNALIKDLSYVYFRPRPFATEPVKLLFYRPSVSSFPSIPIATAFCFAAGAWYTNRRLGIALGILGMLFAWSRVYAGVHYPSDVIAGAALGAGITTIVTRLRFIFDPIADFGIRFAQRLGLT